MSYCRNFTHVVNYCIRPFGQYVKYNLNGSSMIW